MYAFTCNRIIGYKDKLDNIPSFFPLGIQNLSGISLHYYCVYYCIDSAQWFFIVKLKNSIGNDYMYMINSMFSC